jgi:hypothetical protein
MELRDTPFAPAEESDRPPRRWVMGPRARRPAPARVAMAVSLATVGLIVLSVAGGRALDYGRAWLHRQPEYELPFDRIILDPPPPPWIRSGPRGLLEQVRAKSGREEVLNVLDIDLDELTNDFKNHSPWIEGVRRIERAYPNRLIVSLDYREPIAFCQPSGSPSYYLDRNAVILPAEDFEPGATEPLIKIDGLDPPCDPREGHSWSLAADEEGLCRPDPLALSAARLAVFTKGHLGRDRAETKALNIESIWVIDGRKKLWLVAEKNTFINWGEAPGEESAKALTAEQKWGHLLEWARRGGASQIDRSSVKDGFLPFIDFKIDEGAVLLHGPKRDLRKKSPPPRS